jgi:hypothetical protein
MTDFFIWDVKIKGEAPFISASVVIEAESIDAAITDIRRSVVGPFEITAVCMRGL